MKTATGKEVYNKKKDIYKNIVQKHASLFHVPTSSALLFLIQRNVLLRELSQLKGRGQEERDEPKQTRPNLFPSAVPPLSCHRKGLPPLSPARPPTVSHTAIASQETTLEMANV